MAKAKTLKKQKKLQKNSNPVALHSHKVLDTQILTKNALKDLLAETILEGDLETLKDVLIAHIRLQNKTALVRKSKIGRQTLYDILEDKREFNPTIKTLSSLLRALAA